MVTDTADVRLKDIRMLTGMSQDKFAKHFDIPVANIRNWEQGVSKPPVYVLNMMVRLLRYEYEHKHHILLVTEKQNAVKPLRNVVDEKISCSDIVFAYDCAPFVLDIRKGIYQNVDTTGFSDFYLGESKHYPYCLFDETTLPSHSGLFFDNFETVLYIASQDTLESTLAFAKYIEYFGIDKKKCRKVSLTNYTRECIEDALLYKPWNDFDFC